MNNILHAGLPDFPFEKRSFDPTILSTEHLGENFEVTKTSANSISVIAKNRFGPSENSEEQSIILNNQLNKMGFNNFKIYSRGENAFEIIKFNKAEFEKKIDDWASENGGDKAEEIAAKVKNSFEEESLNLSGYCDKIKSFPPGIELFSCLKEINLSQNEIEIIPSELCQLEHLEKLDLGKNKIVNFPTGIERLQNLRCIRLSHNKIEIIPQELFQLKQLETLYLGVNKINCVPLGIEQCVNLKHISFRDNEIDDFNIGLCRLENLDSLDLSENKIKIIPNEIKYLQKLERFNICYNKIENIPREIGDFANLIILNIEHNHISTLPNELGLLHKLQTLDIGNTNLTDLPLSLGQCADLACIYFSETHIPSLQVDAILAMTQAKRNKEVNNTLSPRINAWEAISGESFDLSFIEGMPEKEREDINEWLTRLERTSDFKTSMQQELAKTVCSMLETLWDKPTHQFPSGRPSSFYEIFFTQVPPNLSNCEDRAAMSFNELYLAWVLDKADQSQTLTIKEKLDLIVRSAKTATLRAEIQKRIDTREIELKLAAEENCRRIGIKLEEKMWRLGESVEIYLYYETHLRERLNLLTFMKETKYAIGMGRSSWIDEEELINDVEYRFIDEMLDMNPLKRLRDKDPIFTREWELQSLEFESQTEKLDKEFDDGRGVLLGGDYRRELNALMNEMDYAKQKLTRTWVINQLGLS